MRDRKTGPINITHFKSALVLALALFFAGCGSLQTLLPGSSYRLRSSERYERTYCDSIPRVYSGLSLDLCMAFIGPPGHAGGRASEGRFYAFMVDSVLSFAVDTLALPYTIPCQIKYGDLVLRRKSGRI